MKKKEETKYLPKIDIEKERIDQRRNLLFLAFAGLTEALCASGLGQSVSQIVVNPYLSSDGKRKARGTYRAIFIFKIMYKTHI